MKSSIDVKLLNERHDTISFCPHLLDSSHEQVDIFLANMVFNQQLPGGCRRTGKTRSTRQIDRFIVGATHGYTDCYRIHT